VVQSAGAVFDNEVIRVLKKMPKWKPAIQNGQPVAVTFTQPVTFQAVEE
jgi:protein TonB